MNILITGASSGIGEALAREFASRGHNLALLARRMDRLEALQDELKPRVKVSIQVCDVTRDGDVEKAARAAKLELGSIDVVVANAGFGVVGEAERLALEDYRRQFETNLFGVLRTFKATLAMLHESKGTLAIVGSVNGYAALPGNSPYGMSKAAIRSLCDSLYHELRPSGVAVTHIAPGFVTSEIFQVDNTGVHHAGRESRIPTYIRMDTPVAAKKIANAILKRQREAIITFHGKVAVFLFRHFPGLAHFLIQSFGFRGRLEPLKSPK